MNSGAILETNWIIDVALRQHEGSLLLWQLAQRDEIALFIPSPCFAETLKVLESWRQQWRRLIQIAGDFEGEDARLRQAELQDRIEIALWAALEASADKATILEVTKRVIRGAREVRDLLNLSPADAIVLASAADAADRGICRVLMSRDKNAFGRQDVRAWMEARSILYYDDAVTLIEQAS